MAPQLFIGTSLGAGLNKILEENKNPPTVLELFFTPDIYIPILGLFILIIIAIIPRRNIYK